MVKKDLSKIKTRRFTAQLSYPYQKNANPELTEEDFRNKVTKSVKELCTDPDDKYYLIFHDKDVKEDGELKPLHAHIHFEFKNSRSYTAIYEKLEISREKNLRAGGNKVIACRYLTHRNEKDINNGKYQYDISEVISSENADYRKDIIGKIEKSSHSKSGQNREDFCLELSYQISEQALLLSKAKEILFEEFDKLTAQQLWNKNKKQFELNRQEYIDKEFTRMGKGNRNHIGIYIQGEGGTGKSTLAKNIAEARDEYGQHAPSTNKKRLDLGSGYDGQRTIVINEFDSTSGIAFRELFQILEPNIVNQLSSRFKDAHIINDLTIMTNSDDFFEWSDGWFDKKKEYHQLFRRIQFYIELQMKNGKIGATLYRYTAKSDLGENSKNAYKKVKSYNLGKGFNEELFQKRAVALLKDIQKLHNIKTKKATTSKSSTDQSETRSSNSVLRNEQ